MFSEKRLAAALFSRNNTVRALFNYAASCLAFADGFNMLLIFTLMPDFRFLS
ncbi:hypothetical protein ACR6A7_14625 [Pantoea sp. RRHST58]|uniref:hypothetical protein n=1 Tax=Pantoea sp. RRHST58 TaxID=3425183 RepID=UPI003DA0F923